MRFYAACLASYNNGVLHGAWIDATSDEDEMMAAIAAMLRASKFPNVTVEHPDTGEEVPSAEEWAIHDYDDMPNFGEYPGLAKISEWVQLTEDHDDYDPEDIAKVVSHFCGDLELTDEAFRDNYVGMYPSFRDYAEEFADECVLGDVKNETLRTYFDYASFARDLEMDYTVVEVSNDTVMIFNSN